jgi:hypothetical protein
MRAHQAPVGLLLQRIKRQPAGEGGTGLLQLPASFLPGGEPIEEPLHAHLPLLLLLLMPRVKGGVLAQPEAVEEGTAYPGQGLLHLGDQGGALRFRGERGEALGRAVGLLHQRQVQLQRRLRVQTDQLPLTEQMGVLGRSGVGVGEQAAQQPNGIAQGPARIGGLTVRPEEGGQFAAGMHAAFDRQVEQQRLCLAQGKAEAAAVMKDFRRAEYG